jgi:hypothetical protein
MVIVVHHIKDVLQYLIGQTSFLFQNPFQQELKIDSFYESEKDFQHIIGH